MKQCLDCSKQKVCKYQEDYQDAVELIGDLSFEFPIKVQVDCLEYQSYAGAIRTVSPKEWVKPEEVTCGQTFTWNSDDFTSD